MIINTMCVVAALLGLLVAMKSLRLRGVSSGRTSMRFVPVMLAVLAPVAILLVELNTTATQNDAVIGPSGGKILIAGGINVTNNTGNALASTELYEPATNSFAPENQTATMNDSSYMATATRLVSGPNAGKVFIAGGYAPAGNNPITAATQLYDPVANTFAPPGQTPSMNVARIGATATVLTVGPNAGKILIAGGFDGFNSLVSTELYDPATNSFAPVNGS